MLNSEAAKVAANERVIRSRVCHMNEKISGQNRDLACCISLALTTDTRYRIRNGNTENVI